ncbi:MAG: hypothetical protein ACTMHH_02670 [Nesterenkonia sp.]
MAFAAGSALVHWAEQNARRSATADAHTAALDAQARVRRADQRRWAEQRRERIITEAHLMPHQF